ncbi:MAG: NACHT domain-containing protein [Cyanobacteria bacterium P01_H01_bin.105]
MLGSGVAVAIALLLASTEQSESTPVSELLQWFEDLMPPWLWAVLFIVVALCLLALDVADKYSGIFGSPFQRSQPSTDQLERTRQQLLKIVKKNVNLRLANSLHKLVKLDLYMEDQRQRVGTPKYELVPEDTEPSFQAVYRVLHPKGNKPPLDLKFTQKIIEVFERQDIQGKLLILGEPGSGKTTELLQLAKDLVSRVEQDEGQPVPVILELSSWDGESIDKWATNQLNMLYSLSEATTLQWLVNNQILLLLDGLDELGLTKQRQCIEKINQFLETNRVSELVICCRREEYEAGDIELDGLNGAVYLEALKEDQIREYFATLNRLSLWENVRSNLALRDLAEKPLFLFMLLVAYQGDPIRNEQELFNSYIQKQLHEPGNQGTYKPDKEPTPDKTRYYLVWLAQKLEAISETEFLIEGLQPTWLSSARQKRLFRLSVLLLFGLFVGLSFGLPTGLAVVVFFRITGKPHFGVNPFIIKPREKLQWSFSRGLNFGLNTMLVFGLFGGLNDHLIGGLSGGLMLGLIFGLIFGLSSISIIEKETPNQGIRKSIQNALRGGLIFGLFGGLIVWLGNGLLFLLSSGLIEGGSSVLIEELIFALSDGDNLSFGLTFGLRVGLLGVLISGLDTAIQHLILRIFLTINGDTPWNYARFLDHAVKHRFIQRTGGRYRFVHDLLRKHFAAMPLE